MKGIRLLDIAKQAGVSQATVTRVIRNNGYVSREKRELVEAALRTSGYDLNRLKNCENSGVISRVLFFSPISSDDVGNILFSKIMEETAYALQSIHWQIVPYYIKRISAEELRDQIEQQRSSNIAGIVFNCISLDLMPIRRYLTSLSIPLVMVERAPDIYGLNKVMLHSKEMLFQAVRYLTHLGHQHILFLAKSKIADVDVENQRIEGFREGITAMGVEQYSRLCFIKEYRSEYGYQQLSEYLQSNSMPTAIIAADSVMVGVSNYLYEHGYQVPRDVSLVGIDNTYAPYATPRLTSVDFPVTEIVQNTVRILQESQAEGALPQNILLSSKLIERGSTAAPRKE